MRIGKDGYATGYSPGIGLITVVWAICIAVCVFACDQSTTVSVPGEPDSTKAETIPCLPETIWAPAETLWVQAPPETVWVETVADTLFWPPGWRKNRK